jgi:DUF1680 family protein
MSEITHKTPDFYVENSGVEVEREERYPESGQVSIRINHNKHQSTRLQLGLEQAEELHTKLGVLIAQIRAEQ